MLITGLTGFCGTHLHQHITESYSASLHGISRSCPNTSPENIQHHSLDIHDQAGLSKLLEEIKPHCIYHLVSLLKSPNPQIFYQTNVQGTVALFESIVQTQMHPSVLITSSSAVYGPSRQKKTLSEITPSNPCTHYAISKLNQEMVALYYYHTHQIPVICTRTFNLVGPGQPSTFVCSSFAHQIARAELSNQPATLHVGNLASKRDFVDVRDAVRAYTLLVERGTPGEIYNVCSQKATSIRSCLEILVQHATIPIEIEISPDRLQTNDVPIQVGDMTKLYESTGWEPSISLEQSLVDMLNDWRRKVREVRIS